MNYRLKLLTLTIFFCIALWARPLVAQEAHGRNLLLLADSLAVKNLEEVVVTATRSGREQGALPLPVTLIKKEQIAQMGSLRLNQVLTEQTGLAVVQGHGEGLQVQGFDPDYTLIMIDGEPLIGRTAGTLSLDRIAVGNIKQIEIIKGPSSSLYGSEALAGVVNIITENPEKNSGEVFARYGANHTADLSGSFSAKGEKTGINVFANRYSSAGYDFTPETFGATLAPFTNYTFTSKLSHKFSDNWHLSVSGRYFREAQDQGFLVNSAGQQRQVAGQGTQSDWNLLPLLTGTLGDHWKVTARWYLSGFRAGSKLLFNDDASLHSQTRFEQRFSRPEVQVEYYLSNAHVFTAGAGHIAEQVNADRYRDQPTFNTTYAFLQHEWQPAERLSFIFGGRFDSHSAYQSQLSPKASVRYQATSWATVKASAGAGFKAPDFRQLYLNFSNAVAGYSVYGSEEVAFAMQEYKRQGIIQQVLRDPEAGGAIGAETSVSYQLGLELQPAEKLKWQFNAFHNEVNGLIDALPFARKTNGQFLFSYANLGRVFTQGLEAEIHWSPLKALNVSAGYQYLLAKDRDVLEQIDAGEVFRRDSRTLRTRRVTRADYGGLFNRSRHMANLRIFYADEKGREASLRSVYRGRYGLADLNGNSILDDDREYVPGYLLWNMTLGKKVKNGLHLQAGCDNLLNFRDEQNIPGQPGRMWFASCRFNFQ